MSSSQLLARTFHGSSMRLRDFAGDRFDRGGTPTLDLVEVLLARENGFCFGVKKAVELTEAAAESGRPVFNLGQVVHNPKISERLAARGVKVIQDPADADAGIVVIRAHGVPPAVRASIED